MSITNAYYWADGQKVSLDPDPHIAVNQDDAARHGLWEGELSEVADSDGNDLGNGLVIVPENAVSEELRGRLDETGSSAPVYRKDNSLIAVLPEVRMETASGTTAQQVRSAIAPVDSDAVIDESKPGRFVVKPSSGRGADALDLANRLAEELKPEAAQARFIEITPPQPSDR
jgi:hypothetical protein